MTYYPVGIPTLCRYEHFQRCVESLALNTHADKTELVISLDYPPSEKYIDGYEAISRYVSTIKGFAKVTVIKHEKNLGAVNNWHFVMDYILSRNDAAIMTEDDNEFSPCFLDFMDKALDVYHDDENVRSVTSYSAIGFEKMDCPFYFTHTTCAWGYGVWKHKKLPTFDNEKFKKVLRNPVNGFKIFCSAPTVLSMVISMLRGDHKWGDVYNSCLNILNNHYQVRPTFPLVINRGQDGSGEHCGKNDSLSLAFAKRGISQKTEFEMTYTKPHINLYVRRRVFWRPTDSGKIMIKPQLWALISYIKYLISY